jgi:phosphotransferase system enzyme I (PtsP)
VPSLLWQLDPLLRVVDFLSVGSNDLMQFLFAIDRKNPRIAERYDVQPGGIVAAWAIGALRRGVPPTVRRNGRSPAEAWL